MSPRLLALVCCVAVVALTAVLVRLVSDYRNNTLTAGRALVGLFFIAGVGGWLAAGIQILIQGTGD
jgi:hypothetical protein